jgi:transposase
LPGSDGGAEHWAVVASLTETCKLKDVDPLAYFTDVLTRIVNGYPNRDIDQLLRIRPVKAALPSDACF